MLSCRQHGPVLGQAENQRIGRADVLEDTVAALFRGYEHAVIGGQFEQPASESRMRIISKSFHWPMFLIRFRPLLPTSGGRSGTPEQMTVIRCPFRDRLCNMPSRLHCRGCSHDMTVIICPFSRPVMQPKTGRQLFFKQPAGKRAAPRNTSKGKEKHQTGWKAKRM